jgi:hypothetical protein
MHPRYPAVLLALLLAFSGCRARKGRKPAEAPRSTAATGGVDFGGHVVSPVEGRCPAALEATRDGGLDADRYVVPTARERRVMSEAMALLFGAEPGSRQSATAQLQEIGFEVVDVPEQGAVLVREGARRRGGGAYLVRLGAASRLMVQAPHTFFDEGTLPLACELFARGHAASLFVNTSHRFKSAAQTPGGSFPADVAHARDSLFQAATEGMLRARSGQRPVTIQLHGFGEREAEGVVVLSAGVRTLGLPTVAAAQSVLSRVIDGGVLRFPDDQSELGATTNVQGAAVRQAGGQFLHVELGAPLRRAMLADATFRASVLSTLADAMEGA